MSRLARTARAVTLTILATLLALFLLIQFQQHLLRHRAERLHAEILQLQLHPGTFKDLQALQKEWGADAHYNGQCDSDRCAYAITLTNYSAPLEHLPLWMIRLLVLLGGRVTTVTAGINLQNNVIWGEEYRLITEMTDHIFTYAAALFVRFHAGPHLFRSDELFGSVPLKDDYRAGFEGACTGCIGADIFVTAQTDQNEFRELSQIDFSCISRWISCKSEDELIPLPWRIAKQQSSQASTYNEYSVDSFPLHTLGREAAALTVVQVTPERSSRLPSDDRDYIYANVRLLQILKGTDQQGIFAPPTFQVERRFLPIPAAGLQAGGRYIIAYHGGYSQNSPSFEIGAVIPWSSKAQQQISDGVLLDTSQGDPCSSNVGYSPYEPAC